MSDNPTQFSALKFDKGMTPKVFTPNSATRIEHFDTITEVLRPFRTISEATNNTGQTMSVLALKKFTMMNDVIYACGQDASTPANGAIYSWDASAFDWRNKWAFGVSSTVSDMLFNHKGVLFGLHTAGRYLYSMTTGQAYTQVKDLGAPANGFCDAIIHSKDGCAYWATDNVIHKLSTSADGTIDTGYTAPLTLPNSNFFVRSLSEQGNYLNIAGYDVKTGQSWSLVWDRDSSVVDLTESIQLGSDRVYHNAQLENQVFFVQVRSDMSNTKFTERPVLIIKYLNGNVAETLYEFPVESIGISSGNVGGKWASTNRLYFSALVKMIGESTARNILFCLDYKGRLTIAQNLAVDTGTATVSGVFQQGEGFWIGAGSDGAWFTDSLNSLATTNYNTVSSFETNDIRSENLAENIAFVESYITCEALPNTSATVNSGNFVVGVPYTILTVGTTDFTAIGASANTVGIKFIATGVGTGNGTATRTPSIVIKARKNDETTFSVLKIYNTIGQIKLKLTGLEAVNGLNGLDSARQVRLRLESTGGATITGFQALFKPVADQGNG